MNTVLRLICTAASVLVLGAAAGMPKQVAVVCGTKSTVLLPRSASPPNFLLIKVPAGAASPIWIDLTDNPAAVGTDKLSIDVGDIISWRVIPPLQQVSCIARVPTAVTVIHD